MPIIILPPELQNQIAAGEVVERPSSVVKELMENSLDADAASIQVRISQGGQEIIQVKDDGRGMPAEEISLALTRHATSKLCSLPDLENIKSFGFRGEALPSIASVSRLKLCSIPANWDEGTCVEVNEGIIGESYPVALDKGTEVTVRGLLSNVPARLKFLKTKATEHKKCQEIFFRLALAHPEVDFEFLVDDKPTKRFFSGQNLPGRLKKIWPEKVCLNLREFSLELANGKAWGMAGDPSTAQGRANRIYFYVNKRPVADKMLLSAVRAAYRGSLLSKEYPQAIVFIDIPPEEVDVNTHPAKTEVRFRDEKLVFSLVKRAVEQVLTPANAEPGNERTPSKFPEISRTSFQTSLHTLQSQQVHEWSAPQPDPRPHYPQVTIHEQPAGFESSLQTRDYRYMGQIFATYLLLADKNHLLMLDQHAVHERILYERIRRQKTGGQRKKLLFPLEITLSDSEQDTAARIRDKLHDMGFGFETHGNSLVLSSVPEWLNPESGKDYIQDILADRNPDSEKMLVNLSCKSAIKAGQELTADEALALIDQWFKCPNRDYCPHGRPVVCAWDNSQLEKLFKRGQ
ncbi:MAG: DNA mismatch repair endonuclease MutL [Thermodesulfobacteriota bacterium]